jgi:hypothetical protein
VSNTKTTGAFNRKLKSLFFFFCSFNRARFGAAELHNIASFMGGVASQEAIKLITHQYTPLNNTFLYNGMNSTSQVWTL